MGMSKIALIGTGGVGKTIIAVAVKELSDSVEVYDFDPLCGLRHLSPDVKTEKHTLVQPSILDTRAGEWLIRFLLKHPDVKILIVTTPDVHKVEETRELMASLEYYKVYNPVVGVVISKNVGKESVNLGVKVVGTIPYSQKVYESCSTGNPEGIKKDKKFCESILQLLDSLGIQSIPKKKKGLFS